MHDTGLLLLDLDIVAEGQMGHEKEKLEKNRMSGSFECGQRKRTAAQLNSVPRSEPKKGEKEDGSVADIHILDSYLLVLTLDIRIDRARRGRLTSFDLRMLGTRSRVVLYRKCFNSISEAP